MFSMGSSLGFVACFLWGVVYSVGSCLSLLYVFCGELSEFVVYFQ